MPISTTGRIRNSIAELGWRDAVWHALARLLQRVPGKRCALHRYQFVAQGVAPGSLCGGRGKSIVVAPCLGMETLPPASQRPPRPPATLTARFRQGARCLLASAPPTSQTLLAGWLWMVHGACQEDEVRARYVLPSLQSSWDLDVWVHPELRGGLVFAHLWEEANTLLHEQGVRWSCSRISRFNRTSMAAHARLGTLDLGTATFLRCGHWQWMLASLPPYLHLSRRADSFPSFIFDTSGLPHIPSLELTCRILKQ